MEKIKELCSEERPYEKCERFGAKHLTDIELLAVLLRSGSRGESALQLQTYSVSVVTAGRDPQYP